MPSLKKIKMAEYIFGERQGGQLIDWEQSSQTRLPDGLLNGLCRCAVQADEITRR